MQRSGFSAFFFAATARKKHRVVIKKIVTSGIEYACKDAPENFSFLTCAVMKFATKLSMEDKRGILNDRMPPRVNTDEVNNDWDAYDAFVDCLSDKPSKKVKRKGIFHGPHDRRSKLPKLEGTEDEEVPIQMEENRVPQVVAQEEVLIQREENRVPHVVAQDRLLLPILDFGEDNPPVNVLELYNLLRPESMPNNIHGTDVDLDFWPRLFGLNNDPLQRGWLDDNHIYIWVVLNRDRRQPHEKWWMADPYFYPALTDTKRTNKKRLVDGTMGDSPALWDIERLLLPLNTGVHWVTVELDLLTWTAIVYDSFYIELTESVRCALSNLKRELRPLLDEINYWERANKERPAKFKLTLVFASDVPRQSGILGDCGVWVCIFLHALASGNRITANGIESTEQFAMDYRRVMSCVFYHRRN